MIGLGNKALFLPTRSEGARVTRGGALCEVGPPRGAELSLRARPQWLCLANSCPRSRPGVGLAKQMGCTSRPPPWCVGPGERAALSPLHLLSPWGCDQEALHSPRACLTPGAFGSPRVQREGSAG